MSKINDLFKTIIFIGMIIYVTPSLVIVLKKQWAHQLESHHKIGYLSINGIINNASLYKEQLSHYFKDPSIKAILISIESQGGAFGSCQALAYDIENLKKEFPKPIVTYIENICLSGAYQIAASTDYIIATSTCVIGNIALPPQPITNMQDLLNAYHIKSMNEQNTNATTPCESTSLMFEYITQHNYQQISKEIASKRHVPLQKIDQWGQGKLLTGQQGYDLKLIDIIGSKTTAINVIKKNIIPSDRKIEWVTPSTKNFIDRFFTSYQDEDAYLDAQQYL